MFPSRSWLPTPPERWLRSLLSLQYFLYFAAIGIMLPYFGLYLYDLGFTQFQIGVVMAVRSLSLVVFSLFWGILADRIAARRPIFILCQVMSVVMWSGFLVGRSFPAVLGLTLAYGVFFGPLVSFMEAFSMDILGKDRAAYGRIRVWGTISFILLVIGMGWITETAGTVTVVWGILLLSLAQALTAPAFPPITATRKFSLAGARHAFGRRPVIVFLISGFLMLVSHGTYYGFFSIHLQELGYDKWLMGIYWATAASGEILVMMGSRRLTNRFPLESMLIFSFLTAVLRWTVLGFTSGMVPILISQLLHAFTYGLFHITGILFIDRHMPEEIKTLGQAAFNAIVYGLGTMAGSLFSGWRYEALGGHGLFLVNAGVALAVAILFAAGGRNGYPPRSPDPLPPLADVKTPPRRSEDRRGGA